MKLRDAIDGLARSGTHVFTVYDIAKMLGKSTAYASLLLSKSKKAHRIERGKYYIEGVSSYEIASNIVYPSYVSMHAALQYYGLMDQNVLRYSVITLKRHKPINVGGTMINFIRTKKKSFFGYTRKSNTYIASPEKLFVDCLYFGGVPFSVLKEAIATAREDNLIDIATIGRYAVMLGSRVLVSKLGFLLEFAGINADTLLRYRYRSYISVQNTGASGKNKKWGINYD
jgi:predicted transcriptional regulator of viral defense system